MLAAALGLVLWPVLAPYLGCPASALYIAPFWILVSASTLEAAALRRRAFIGFYLAPRGGLGRLLRPGFLLLALQGAKAGFFTLLLLVGALALTPGQRGLLLADVGLLLLLQAGLWRLFGAQMRPDLGAPLLRHWAHWVNALLLWLGLLAVAWVSPKANYTGLDWNQALLTAAVGVDAGCDALSLLGRLQSAASALLAWASQNLLLHPGRSEQALVAWLLMSASLGVSFLFAWACSRTLGGVTARPLALFKWSPRLQ